MYCINCGTKLEENCRFCHNCGTEAGHAGSARSAGGKVSSGKKKFPILVVLILAIVAAAAAAVLLSGGSEKVNPAYTAMLEEHGYADYSVLKGNTVSYLSDLGDGILMKLEYAYEGDIVTEHCMYLFNPLGELKWNQQYIDQLKNNINGWDVVIKEDYYISVDKEENLDTEEGVRKYYELPADEHVDLIEIEMIKRIYSTTEGYIPRETAE